jgi:hypothetical protein
VGPRCAALFALRGEAGPASTQESPQPGEGRAPAVGSQISGAGGGFRVLQRTQALHYEVAGDEFTQERLAALFDLVVTALQERQFEPVGAYCEDLAQRRFEAGFGISEVQTAFTILEETMWKHVVAGVPLQSLPRRSAC